MLFFFVLNEALWIKWIIFDLSFSIFEINHYFCGMLRIVGHIEHLLSVHDCVIVPDFGGFVVQTLPVRYDAGMHRFEPMRKDIVFNETLQYNDGLLIEAYMQAEKTDYRTARQLMHEDVALLRAGLQRDGVLKMENIGSFSMGEEGQLIFQADEAGWLNAPMLGLEDFTFEPLSEQMPGQSPIGTCRSGNSCVGSFVPGGIHSGQGGKPFGIYGQFRADRDDCAGGMDGKEISTGGNAEGGDEAGAQRGKGGRCSESGSEENRRGKAGSQTGTYISKNVSCRNSQLSDQRTGQTLYG